MKATLLFTALIAGSLSGCSVKTAQSPQLPIGAVQRDRSGNPIDTAVRFFPAADITFKYSQVFMWKDGTSTDDISTVVGNANDLEDANDKVYTLTQEVLVPATKFKTDSGFELSEYLDRVESALPAKQSSLTTPLKTLDSIKASLASAQAQLDDLQKQPASDEVNQKIAALNKSIAGLNTQITKTSQQITRIQGQIDAILKDQAAVEAAHLDSVIAEWKDLNAKITLNRNKGNEVLASINKLAWLFDIQPITFSFHFDADRQTVHAAIHNLDYAHLYDPELTETDVPLEYSTEGTFAGHVMMDKVTYDPVGGVFTFEVYTPKGVYFYKIARTKYDATDGRIHYKGDILHCAVKDGTGQPQIVHVRDHAECGVSTGGTGTAVWRRGALNLVDQDYTS